MRRLLILTTTLLAVALLTACGGDDTTGGDDDNTGPGSIFGTYTLITVNGEDLPVEVPPFTITSGTLRLNSDNTYSVSTPAIFQGEPATFTDTGTFTVDGSTIQFSGVSSGDFSGTISGNTLTMSDQSLMLVYRK
jgi:hypothetical protein